jgi:hypothetical protein
MTVPKADVERSVAWIYSVRNYAMYLFYVPYLSISIQVHEAGDSLDAEKWITTFYTPECKLYFASNPVLDGQAAILMTMKGMMSKLSLMKHK